MYAQFIKDLFNGDMLLASASRVELLPIIHKIFTSESTGEKTTAVVSREDYITSFQGKSGVLEFHPVFGKWQVEEIHPGTTAVVPIVGVISKYGFWDAGTKDYIETLKALDASPNVDKIVLRIDSGGGSVRGTRDLAAAIENLTKPTAAYVDDLAASAAYWIASATDEIWANNKLATVGSIGTFTTIMDVNGYLTKMGLSTRDIYSRLSPDKNKDYRDALSGNDELMKDRLDFITSEFIGYIKNRRPGIDIDSPAFMGNTYFAEKALQIGLIDGIGTLDEMLDIKTSSKQKLHTNMKLKERIAAFFGAKSGISDADITACNEQLANDGIQAFVVAATDEIPDHASLQAGMDATNAELERLTAELETASATLGNERAARETAEGSAASANERLNAITALFGEDAKADGFDVVSAITEAIADAKKYHDNPSGNGAVGTGAESNEDAGIGDSFDANELSHNKYADLLGFAGPQK